MFDELGISLGNNGQPVLAKRVHENILKKTIKREDQETF